MIYGAIKRAIVALAVRRMIPWSVATWIISTWLRAV